VCWISWSAKRRGHYSAYRTPCGTNGSLQLLYIYL
jgi:hypothetical protein